MGLATLKKKNKMNFIGKVSCNSCKALLAELQGPCKTRLAPEQTGKSAY